MLRPFTPARSLVFLACVSCLLIFTLVPRYDLLSGPDGDHIVPRAIGLFPDSTDSSTSTGSDAGASSSATPSATPTSTPASTSSSTTDTSSSSQQPAQQSSSSAQQTSSQPSSTSSPPSGPSSASSTQPPSQTSAPAQTFLSSSATVDEDGETTFVEVTVTRPAQTSSASASTTAGSDQTDTDDSSSKGVSTPTIIGLSVAGGIALLGIIAFVIWKFTRKRFADDFDDTEAIKWPELNVHGDSPHALPTTRAGSAGFETNSEVNLTRPDSRAGSYAASAAASAVDLYAPNAAQDPYAVPPLPHQNPNLPYRDDPVGGRYDPYSGPIPQTFADTDSIAGGEAIPMTQIGRARSPAPPMGYDLGRASPGPQMAYEAGRMSPGPQAAFAMEGGRSSPARMMSPGPGVALSGRASPGPQAAYGYGGGPPPGLHQGY